jgi:iron(III) transport system ATP-binding protein
MERPTSGSVISGDTTLSDATTFIPIEKRRIGLVFQDFALFPHLNVIGNVAFGLNKYPKPERRALSEKWIDILGLSHRSNAYPHQLSGGEQQRVAIARALAPSPVAMLLDEPFSGLDPSMREHVRHVALDAVRAAGVPALLVTHDAAEALVHADKIAIIDAGRILQCSHPDSAYAAPLSEVAARALGPLYKLARSEFPKDFQTLLPQGDMLHYRPEAIIVDPTSSTKLPIARLRLAGALTEMTLKHDQSELFAAARRTTGLNIGDEIPIRIDPDLVYSFDA